MKALILNSGMGSRMGALIADRHKSMIEISDDLPLVIYQIETIASLGITDFVITTGHVENKLREIIGKWFGHRYRFEFVYNPDYRSTNYIYSMYAALHKLDCDLLLLHGDLYFTRHTTEQLFLADASLVVIDSSLTQPAKDFKARVCDNRVKEIATYIYDDNCFACQPLYKLKKTDWRVWANAIRKFCHEGKTSVYAEEALNTVLDDIELRPLDLRGTLCMEIDTPEDLVLLKSKISKEGNRA